MVEERDFRQRIQEIGRLIADLDQAREDKARALLQLMMDLHGAGLERIMEIVFAEPDSGRQIIDKLGRDPVAGSLLVLHGLHPDDLETRVARALDQVAARLRQQEVEVQLLGIAQGTVRVRARPNAHACGSTAATVRAEIEEAVYEAAPEVASVVIEDLEPRSSGGFVALEKLAPAALAQTETGD